MGARPTHRPPHAFLLAPDNHNHRPIRNELAELEFSIGSQTDHSRAAVRGLLECAMQGRYAAQLGMFNCASTGAKRSRGERGRSRLGPEDRCASDPHGAANDGPEVLGIDHSIQGDSQKSGVVTQVTPRPQSQRRCIRGGSLVDAAPSEAIELCALDHLDGYALVFGKLLQGEKTGVGIALDEHTTHAVAPNSHGLAHTLLAEDQALRDSERCKV